MSERTAGVILACVLMLCLTMCSVSEDWQPKKCIPVQEGK